MDALRRKLTVRAHGQTLVLVKRREERVEHVYQKALLWALYLPAYPTLRVEVSFPAPLRYKPDLLALDPAGGPLFWGECGVVSADKLEFLLKRFPWTHLVLSKWAARLDPLADLVGRVLAGTVRRAPVELLAFPPAAGEWVEAGEIDVSLADVEVRRWGPSDWASVRAAAGRGRRRGPR